MGSAWLANSWLTRRQFLVWRVRGRLLFISTTICQSFAAIFLRPHQRAGWQHSVQLPRSSKRRVGLHLALSGARGTSGSGAATRASFTSVKKRVRHKFGADSTKQRSTRPKNVTHLKQFGSKSILMTKMASARLGSNFQPLSSKQNNNDSMNLSKMGPSD